MDRARSHRDKKETLPIFQLYKTYKTDRQTDSPSGNLSERLTVLKMLKAYRTQCLEVKCHRQSHTELMEQFGSL